MLQIQKNINDSICQLCKNLFQLKSCNIKAFVWQSIYLIIIISQFLNKRMSSKQYNRNSLSRDKSGIKNLFPQMEYMKPEKTFFSQHTQQNLPFPSKKQSSKSYISLTKQPETNLQIKRKGSQIINLHQQYNNLKDQMKRLPDRNINAEDEGFSKGRERSQQVYIEDDIDRQIRSQSSEQNKIIRKRDSYIKKRQLMSWGQLPKPNANIDDDSIRHAKRREHQTSQAYSYAQKHPKAKDSSLSSANYLNRKNISCQSSPPMPNFRNNSQQKQREVDSPIKMGYIDIEAPQKQVPRVPRLTTDKSLMIKNKLERFSMCIDNNMDAILDKMEELEKKYLSLDLYFQELRQSISHKKAFESENKEISSAKHRQYKFLIGQYESKVKQVKGQNQRLEKELNQLKQKEDQNRSKIIETERRLKQFQALGQNFEKLKKLKNDSQKKLGEAVLRMNQLERQKGAVEGQLERLKKNIEMQESVVKQEQNASHFISNTTLFGSYDDADYLKQQVSKLEYENKEYQKLIGVKSTEISNLSRSNTQTKMMMEKIKEMNEQLEKQCSKLQRDIVQKQLEATEKMCSLNNSIKKKLKQHDNFKDLIVQCLDQVYKKTPKKIRKNFDSDVLNKNRTNKCQVMFKCINTSICFYEEQFTIMSQSFLKDFSISPIEMEKIGLEACFKKIKEDSLSSMKLIDSLKLENKNFQTEIQKVKQQALSKSMELNAIIAKQKDEQNYSKKQRLQNKKDIPTNDMQGRQSTGSIQDMSKRKAEIEKLNKEVDRLIQQSHQKYLKYEAQIADLQMKEKQLNSKILEYQSERNEFLSKITQKDNFIKGMEKNLIDIKAEKEGLVLKITQITNENKKIHIENQSKINKLQNENQSSKKKMKKWKNDVEVNEKALNAKISIKDKTINDLLEQKKKLTVEVKLVTEKLQFAKILQETKEKQPKIIQIPRFTEQDERYLQDKIVELNDQVDAKDNEIQNLASIIKNININLSDKEKQIEKIQLQLRRKEEQIQNNLREMKQKQARKSHINEQYKKMTEQARRDKQELQKKFEQQKDKKTKQYNKICKQLQSKQEEISSLLKQKNDEIVKSTDLEQKLSQSKIENQELLRLIHKKQDEVENKQNAINEQKQLIANLKQKNAMMEKELLQRQQYFKKSEALMQQLINQNEESKTELSKKEMEIMELIKQRQQLNFRLSEDLDAKSENMKMVRFNLEHDLALLKEQLEATEMNLVSTKQQLKIKNNLVEQLKETINAEKKEIITTQQTRDEYESQLKQNREDIDNLNNKIDILEEQLEEAKIRLNDREEQLNNAKKEKNKYYKILQQKAEYIDELQEAVKLKCNQVDQMKQIQQELEEAREQFEQNQQKYKKEIQQLHENIKELEDKSIETINQLKKDIAIYKEQLQECKENIEKQKRNYKLKCTEKQELAKQIEKKEQDLINLIKRYDELKVRMSQQLDEKSIDKQTLLQQKIKELDEKDYQLQQIKQDHKKALKAQLNEFNLNLESYRANYNILEKQLGTYKETNIILTLKCDSLERQCKELLQRKDNQKSIIISQSPNHPDFASVDLDLPERQTILKHLLSESFHHKRFAIVSKIIDEAIQIRQVKEEVIHHYEQPFEICEESRYSWPSIDIRENNEKDMIKSEYLQRFQNEINEILVKKQESFGPTFLNLHSNSAIQVLNCIRYQLVEYRNNMNEEILEELQYIDNHQIDFCENVEPEIEECIQLLSVYSTKQKQQKKQEEQRHQKQFLKLNQMRESHQHKQQLRLCLIDRERLQKELNTAALQLKLQQNQIKQLIEKGEEEAEQQEKCFMNQSEILRKELAKEKARADRNQCNFLTVKKAIEKLLQLLCSKEECSDELEDTFEHLSKICDEKDVKLKKIMDNYLMYYNEQQQLGREKDQANKKKKGFFGFN